MSLRDTTVGIRNGRIAVTYPSGVVRAEGPTIAAIEVDLRSKYAVAEDSYALESGAPCVVLGAVPETLRTTRLKRSTLVSFPEFYGWTVYMAEVSRYTLCVVLVKR